MKIKTRKGDIQITFAVMIFIAIAVGVVILRVSLSMLGSVEGTGPCSRLWRGVASVLADMTGVNMCQ